MTRYNNGRCFNAVPCQTPCQTPCPTPAPIIPPVSHHCYVDSLAVAFVIKQPNNPETYDVHTALHKGTLYPDLYKPYTGRRCMK